jgi:hypothetical protein
MEGTSWKHLAMVLACVHLIPDGTTNLPLTFFSPSRYGVSNHSRVLFKMRPLYTLESHPYGARMPPLDNSGRICAASCDTPKLQW